MLTSVVNGDVVHYSHGIYFKVGCSPVPSVAKKKKRLFFVQGLKK